MSAQISPFSALPVSSGRAALTPHSVLPRTETFIINPHVSITRSCGRVFLTHKAKSRMIRAHKKKFLSPTDAVDAACLSRWVSILSITTGSSIQAMILTAPPHLGQISISILNSRFNRCPQVIAARRSAADTHCSSSPVPRLRPLRRLAGMTCIRCLLFGANTPLKRVRLTRGLGTNAAKRAVSWFRKAADKGEATVMFNVGVCYERGEGVAKDYTQAVSWYRKAVKKGYPLAQKRLKELGY